MNSDDIYIDELTNTYNRRYLKEKQSAEILEFQSKKIPFSLVMIDIDRFKEINDIYGHLKGDEVIRAFADFLKAATRPSDRVIRYGGDEFTCFMANTTKKDAEQVYRRFLKKCKEEDFRGLKITISVGISSYPEDGEEMEALLKIADEALLEAKRSGRDQIGVSKPKRLEVPIKIFVDRNEEKERLRGVILNNEKSVRVAVIKGNLGIGKTTLVKEILNAIRGREIIWTNCLSFSDEVVYYPIRELMRYKINRQGEAILKEIAVPYRVEIGKLIPGLDVGVTDEDVESIGLVLDRYRLYESVRRAVEIGPTEKIVVIDNIHWVDHETLELIKYLLRSIKDLNLVFVMVLREEEKKDVLADFMTYISREIEVKEIRLGPFGYHDVKICVDATIGEKSDEKLARYVFKESGGNPFFIEEIMKELHEMRYLSVVEDAWEFKEPEHEIVPKSIADAAQRRYNSLSKEAQEILEIASVIGRFDIEIMKEITGYNEGHIIGMVENIKRLGFTKEYGTRIDFQEEISRDAIYDQNVAGVKARVLHSRVADNLIERYKGREEEVLEELAFHYYRSREKEKGVKYCMEAGVHSREQYANTSALKYYSWADELLKDEKGVEKIKLRIDCLSRRAEVLNFIGNNDGAVKDFETALALAIEMGDKRKEVELKHSRSVIYYTLSKFDEAIAEAEMCLAMYAEQGNQIKMAELLTSVGSVHRRLGEYSKALERYDEALRLNREIGNKGGEARTLNNIGNIHMNLGDYSLALEQYDQAQKIFVEAKDKRGQATILNNIGSIYYIINDHIRSLANYEACLKILREIGYKDLEATVLNNIGSIKNRSSDYTGALKLYDEALKGERAIGNKDSESLVLSNTGNVYKNLGDLERAKEYFEEALKIGERIRAKERIMNAVLGLGDIHLKNNEFNKAKSYLDRAYDIASESKDMMKEVLPFLGDYYLTLKDTAGFEKVMPKLSELSKGLKLKNFDGYTAKLLGRYYVYQKNFESANDEFKKALSIANELKDSLSGGIVLYYLAKMEQERGNKTGAEANINKALQIFKDIGSKWWFDKAATIFNDNPGQ